MVADPKLSWKLAFSEIWRPLLVFVLVSVIAVTVNRSSFDHPLKYVAIPDRPITFLGTILGILLGFRINSAYGRWWEARILWGGLVNQSRTLSRQAITFVEQVPKDKCRHAIRFSQDVVCLQIALVHSLRCGLRRQQPWDTISPFVSPSLLEKLKHESNIVAALLREMSDLAVSAAGSGLISEWRLQRLDATFTEISNIQGGCERIKNTPLPRQYDFYPELFVSVYCVLLPICLVDELRLFTPLITFLVSFVMLVLNRLGKNLEDPFENTVYDVPMSSLSKTIEINLRQMLGEQQLPPAVKEIDGVVW